MYLKMSHVLFKFICVCLRIVQRILFCVFVLFVFVLSCQFLWIVHVYLPFRYSLSLIYSCYCTKQTTFMMIFHNNLLNQQNGIIRVIVQNELTLFRVNDFSSGYCTNSMILLGANIPRKCEDTKGVTRKRYTKKDGQYNGQKT